jgi:hypothetical protein
MTENDRRQRMAERILEDERLRGDLEDSSATPLIEWASARAAAAAADPARSDDLVEADVQAVRQATRAAARSGETDPTRLIAIAKAALGESSASQSGAIEAAPGATPAPATEPAGTSAGEQPSTQAPEIAAEPASPVPPKQPKPAGSNAQSRRKRHRLADYLKRVSGGH